MTVLLVVEDIEAGRYSLSDRAEASQLAMSQEPSSVGIKAGQSMTIGDLCKSIMVKSANDAAVVLAEHAGLRGAGAVAQKPGAKPGQSGEYAAFIARMNARAKELGMANTVYASANGLPPKKDRSGKPLREFDSSTAGDLLKLAREVIRHPKILEWTSLAKATVTDGSGKQLELYNHNNFLAGSKDTPRLEGRRPQDRIHGRRRVVDRPYGDPQGPPRNSDRAQLRQPQAARRQRETPCKRRARRGVGVVGEVPSAECLVLSA